MKTKLYIRIKMHMAFAIVVFALLSTIWSNAFAAGEGYLSPSIPNDGSHHTAVDVDPSLSGMQPLVTPAGSRWTVIKVALSPDADASNMPDFRMYQDPAHIATFDNPGDFKDVYISPTIMITNVEWLADGNTKIFTFRLDHTQHRDGVSSDEEWQIEIKNNDTAPREFFIGIGHSNNADEITAITEATINAEIPYIQVLSAPIDFGEVLSGITLPQDLPDPQDLRIVNIGTGDLNISEFGNPDNAAFAHSAGGLPTPYPMQPLGTPLNIPVSFTPGSTLPLGPVSSTMVIANNSYNKPDLSVDLSATPVKLEVVMLYDISTSMALTPDDRAPSSFMEMRIGRAKMAGQQVQLLLQELEGNSVRAGLVTFPWSEEPSCTDGPSAFTKIPGPGSNTNVSLAPFSIVANQFSDAWGTGVDSLQPGGLTPMAEGLMVAHGTGTSNFGEGKWTESQYARRALLLLSDGHHISPKCDSVAPLKTAVDWADYLETTQMPVTRRIKIFSIPYGTAIAVDHDTLERLGNATGGSMYSGDVLDFAALYKQFRSALIDWRSDWNEIIDPKGTLTKGEGINKHEVCIDDNAQRIAFIVDWDKLSSSAVDFALEGPDGVVSSSSPDVSYHANLNSALYVVKGQTAKGHDGSDKWTLRLSGGSGLDSGEALEYSYSVITKSKVNMSIDSGMQKFYALRDQMLLEVKIAGLSEKLKGLAQVELKYDIPKESYGSWLSSMAGFDPKWLVNRNIDLDQRLNAIGNKKDLSIAASAEVRESESSLIAPATIMGEPATMVQRKAFALENFAKRPFKNLRSTGEAMMYDNGTHGDRIAGDGIYSAYLPMLAHDGLAKIGILLNIDSEKDCLNRELWINKVISVALNPEVIIKSIEFHEAIATYLYPHELVKIMEQARSSGYDLKNVVFKPVDSGGNYWGPGKAGQINYAMKNAEALGSIVDNLDGSYTQVIQYKKGDNPSVVVTVRGVSSPEIPMKKPIPKYYWWIIILGILILLAILIIKKLKKT